VLFHLKKDFPFLPGYSHIKHTRHRSIWNFIVTILGALAAYALQPKTIA
jgi:hypothetical protein